ncbi:MAG TPA: TRAP transporter substrate-binding protein DctP [Anaerolineae bacterium]|nr:TRAP transporter substrate-binding protein DctP [Anaerolineae bacterium]HMR68200.1 TRAP transporter substrate-binding protein DctP [Anaerolineae bacterium]
MITEHTVKTMLAHSIREARKSLGLRQIDLSDITGLPTSYLSGLERGTRLPTISTLLKISHALDRPLEYFLREDSRRPRSLGMICHAKSMVGQAAHKFAQLVEQKAEGEIKARLYQYGALGNAQAQIESLAEGAIHLYIDELLGFEHYAELCGLVFLPFFFHSRQQYNRFVQSETFEAEIFQPLLQNGIRLLNPTSTWECGSFELLFSTQPIFEPDDLRGRRLRSYDSPVALELRHLLDTDPQVVEWSEIIQAFERGAIDAALIPAAHFSALDFRGLARYATFLDYGYTSNFHVAVNDREYSLLSPAVQQALAEAVEEAGHYCAELDRQQTALNLEKLSTEQGVAVIHPDPACWRSRFDQAIQQLCLRRWPNQRRYETLQSI